MKTIALTGATGFIGRHLSRELPKRGYKIRVLLRRPAPFTLDCESAVIGDLSRPQNLAAAFAGVDAVVHSAGLAHAMSGVPADDYRIINTEGTTALARAAAKAGSRRFVFLSSIRAQTGPSSDFVQAEDLEPRPTDEYGRSKLAAEQALSELNHDWVSLRPVLVYGPGVKGNIATLLALAHAKYPLPLGRLRAKRSLLSLDNLTDAVAHVLSLNEGLRRPFIVSDQQALTVSEMVTIMRTAMDRRPRIFSIPQWLVKKGLKAAGKQEWIERLCCPLVASSTALQESGWIPKVATDVGLAALAREIGTDVREKAHS